MKRIISLKQIGLTMVMALTLGHTKAQSLDATFDPGTGFSSGFATGIDCKIYTIAQQPDGKYLAGGIFTSYNGIPAKGIVRLNNNGSLDGTFVTGTGFGSSGSHARIYNIAVQQDGKILVAGDFFDYNGTPCNTLVRLNSDGTLDASFNGSNGSYMGDIIVQQDGKILSGTVRLNSDGSVDNTFSTTASSIKMALRSDGKIVGLVFRLNADGSKDNSFNIPGSGFNAGVTNLALQPDGKLIVSGQFQSFNGVSRKRIARLNTDGTLDAGYELIASSLVNTPLALALQPDGKLLVSSPLSVYRLNTNGQFDNPFGNIGTNGDVLDMLVQSDKKIMLVGDFTKSGQTARNCILRVNGDNGTGIDELKNDGFTITPNPSTGTVQLKFADNEPAQISIADMMGKVLQSFQSSAHTNEIKLDYPNGVYIITVKTKAATFTKQITLQK